MNINITLATSWNELSEKQLKEISYALEKFHEAVDREPTESHPVYFSKLYLNLVKNLLRTNNAFKVWFALRQIPPDEYREHVQFLLNGVQRTTFLPAFKLKKKKYHPPLNRLQNITIKEFSFLDSMYYNWRKTRKDIYLNHLCAALYRQAGGTELDIRKPFNKVLIEKEVQNFSKLSRKKKVAIAYTYEGCRNYITKLYPHIFPPAVKQDPEEKAPAKEPVYTPFGQLLIYKIQFDTSKLESTQNLNAHEFLGIYENELIELKKQK